uniref:Uncharacterized protein n=1 Tax=Wolfiporia cocos TaxID=81056 RepID=A0A7G7YDR0_9APHY|nr:hypothetical protein [Wolfiporia cocos]QNH92630.1 hypothetical protein [Wolfiporia cocos]
MDSYILEDIGWYIRCPATSMDTLSKVSVIYPDWTFEKDGLHLLRNSPSLTKGGIAYLDLVYGFGQLRNYFRNIEWVETVVAEFLNEIPKGVILSVLPMALGLDNGKTLMNSLLVNRNTDYKLVSEMLLRAMNGFVNKYGEKFEGWEDSLLCFAVKMWLDETGYEDSINFNKRTKVDDIIKHTHKIELKKVRNVNKAVKTTQDKLYNVNKLTELVNTKFNSVDWFDQYKGSIFNEALGDFNPFSEQFMDISILDIPGFEYYAIRIPSEINLNTYVFVRKNHAMEDWNLFLASRVKYPGVCFADTNLGANSYIFERKFLSLERLTFYIYTENSDKKGNIHFINSNTAFPDFPIHRVVRKENFKIGTLALNYFVNPENRLIVYCIGTSLGNKSGIFENKVHYGKKELIGNDLVSSFFIDLFNNSKINGIRIHSIAII